MAYAVFLPIQIDTVWFWIGVIVFSISTILSAIAMINFATTSTNQPVTKGLYRISRNPVQVLAIVMLIGIGIATLSWIIVAAALLLAIISYPTFLVQERSCLDIYSHTYNEYMNKTPRWIGIPKLK
ncbi:methyltransferase family protein [Chloroflexota bacterium]